MRCFVYKSLKKADTYVYLGQRDDVAVLPEPLRAALGELSFVLEVELDAQRKLAREDAGVVRSNLAARGFHVQFPNDADVLAPAVDGAWQRHARD
jgi:uncharacterized protein YcgL (UPF0745 family)